MHSNILIVTMEYPPVSLGGAATVPLYQAEGLAKLGIDTHVMFDDRITGINQPRLDDWAKRDVKPSIDNLTLHPVRSGLPTKLDVYAGYALGYNPSASRLFKSLVHQIHPTIFHFHNYSLFGDHLIDVASRTGKPVYIALHDFWPICPAIGYLVPSGIVCRGSIFESKRTCFFCCLRQRKPVLSRLVQSVEFYTKRVTKFVVGNDYLKHLLVSKGFPASMIEKVPYALDTTAFSEPPIESSLIAFRQRFRLDNKLVILYTGKLHETKGVHVLIESFRNLQRHCPNVVLTIVGDGTDRRRLESMASCNDSIRFLGKLSSDDLHCAYATSDIFVMPSIYPEFFSISSHEAMLCRKPVVATDYAALPEFIVHGENGLLFKRGDVIGLETALRTLIDNPILRDKMGQRGQEMARRFSKERHIDSLLQLYRKASSSAF